MGEKSGTAKKKTATTKSAVKKKAAAQSAKGKKAPARAAKKAAPRKAAAAETQGETPSGSVAVVNAENKRVSDLVLHPEVFGVAVNDHLLYEAVKQYRANARSGTHATKNRALVSGSGKKPWRQKGTGRARVGEIRTPLWRHGGTVFGPQPRDYSYAMPKKARAAALRSALSQRVKDGALKVVDHFDLAEPRTRELVAILGKLEITGKTLLVDSKPTDNLVLSGRNIPGLKVVDPTQVNVYDVLDCRNLLVTQEALTKLEERLTP
jgi:large subunit ribosomal protein L4